MKNDLLRHINAPKDLRQLDRQQLADLAHELREFIMQICHAWTSKIHPYLACLSSWLRMSPRSTAPPQILKLPDGKWENGLLTCSLPSQDCIRRERETEKGPKPRAFSYARAHTFNRFHNWLDSNIFCSVQLAMEHFTVYSSRSQVFLFTFCGLIEKEKTRENS